MNRSFTGVLLTLFALSVAIIGIVVVTTTHIYQTAPTVETTPLDTNRYDFHLETR